jgi:Copper amine oxidase, enzyme domain
MRIGAAVQRHEDTSAKVSCLLCSCTGWQTVQLLPPSHPLIKAGAWTKYHLAVTRRKDSEPRSVASRYDTYVPGKPFVSLDDFIDGKPKLVLVIVSCLLKCVWKPFLSRVVQCTPVR